MVIYFTGTGNSKYLAGLLAKKLSDTLVDSAEFIKSGHYPSFESEKPYIFVAPTYAWRLPKAFIKWLGRCRFEGNKSVYFIMNCGSEIGAAEKYTIKLSKQLSFSYMGTAEIVMPENYLVMFDPPPEDRDLGTIENAESKCEEIAKKILSNSTLDKVKTTLIGYVLSGMVNNCFYRFYVGARKFYAEDTCISCGKCSEKCMLNNIRIIDGRPVWGTECTHCMACISNCPAKAIEYGKNTKGRRRYICPKD